MMCIFRYTVSHFSDNIVLLLAKSIKEQIIHPKMKSLSLLTEHHVFQNSFTNWIDLVQVKLSDPVTAILKVTA